MAGVRSESCIWPVAILPPDWTSPPAVISVLLVPGLQSSQDDEGGADAALYLPGQRVPARAEEPLADPLPRGRGFSVFAPDTDEAAPGEAVGLWRVRNGPFSFHMGVICVSLLASQLHLKFPSLKLILTRLD